MDKPTLGGLINVGVEIIPMLRLPKDPLTPAKPQQILIAGLASLITGIVFLVFSALVVQMTLASGRIRLPSVILLIAIMLVIAIGFLDFAFAALRKKERRPTFLLSNTTLYLVGGFLVVVPILIVGFIIQDGSNSDAWLVPKVLSLSSIGILAIRLAHIRRKRNSNHSPEPPPSAVH